MPCKKIEMADPAQKPKRVGPAKNKYTGFQYIRNKKILGSSIYEYTGFQYIRNLCWIPAAVLAKIKTSLRIHSLVKIHRKTCKM